MSKKKRISKDAIDPKQFLVVSREPASEPLDSLVEEDHTDNMAKKFNDKLKREVATQQNFIIAALVDAAKEGDSQALKQIIDRVFAEQEKKAQEEYFPLTDEQYEQIIRLAATEILGLYESPVEVSQAQS